MTGLAVVRSLVDGPTDDEEAVVRRLGEAIGATGGGGCVQLSLGGPDEDAERREWRLPLDPAPPGAGGTGSGDVWLHTAPETFLAMAAGSYAPVQAYLDGRLRVRGDVDLAKRVLRHLAGPEGRVDCR